MGDHQRVAVRGCAGQHAGANRAASAAAVFHNHALPEFLTQPEAHNPGHDVHRAARSERGQQGDGPGWKVSRSSGRDQTGGQQ